MMGAQLNIGEGRNGLARRVFFGNLGQLRQGCAKGMEDQLGALGLGLNAIIYWNSLYIDAAVKALHADGQLVIGPEIRARLTPLIWEHINFHGSYPFTRPEAPGNLRPLRDVRAKTTNRTTKHARDATPPSPTDPGHVITRAARNPRLAVKFSVESIGRGVGWGCVITFAAPGLHWPRRRAHPPLRPHPRYMTAVQ